MNHPEPATRAYKHVALEFFGPSATIDFPKTAHGTQFLAPDNIGIAATIRLP